MANGSVLVIGAEFSSIARINRHVMESSHQPSSPADRLMAELVSADQLTQPLPQVDPLPDPIDIALMEDINEGITARMPFLVTNWLVAEGEG
jgi:hypothetical protein